MKQLQIADKNDFSEGLHMFHSEPHFYDASYKQADRIDPYPLMVMGDV